MLYTERGRVALLCYHHTLDGLQATLLSVELGRQSQDRRWVLELHREDEPADEPLEAAAERAAEIRVLFGELSTQSHASERFAENVLGVSIETWFEGHSDGESVLEAVREGLDDGHWEEVATAELDDGEAEPGDDSWVTLEDIVKVWYRHISRGGKTRSPICSWGSR